VKRVRVLVTDDSLFMRASIKRMLATDPRIEVVGEAKDGAEAIARVRELSPDVVTMDFNMPVLDGAGALRGIMKLKPTPVVMLSAHTTEGARETFEALAAGAVDFLAKPSGEVSADFGRLAPTLVAKVLAAAEARPAPLPPLVRESAAAERAAPSRFTTTAPGFGPRVVVVGVSTGGPAALGRFLPSLPVDPGFAVIIVQHMPIGFTPALAERLDGLCALRVREARSGDRPGSGTALIAPGDQHLEVAPDGTLLVTDGPEVNGVRPSADVTMRAAARVWGRRVTGVVMTGMGRDGADGLLAIKRAGGTTLAQDRDSCVVFGMPRAAIEAGAVDEVVALDGLAEALQQR
jgi:two-component system, chemotaxis family, protein-glutamate methylesterase/glutaminase